MDRRGFLQTALVTGAAGSAAGLGPLTRATEVAAQAGELLPGDWYIGGALLDSTESSLSLVVPDDKTGIFQIELSPDSWVQRQSARQDITELRQGDRVECWAPPDAKGVRTAAWVNINSRYGHGVIRKIDGNEISVEVDHYNDTFLTLVIGDETTVVSSDGFDIKDNLRLAKVDDLVVFTGTSDSPLDTDPVVWAYVVNVDCVAGSGDKVQLGVPR